MQTTINQRIKFLLENFGLSARNFGKAIGVAENTTQNYLEPRLAQPKADYLERVLLHFESINARWLLTGQGEPFLSNPPTEASNTASSNKKISRSFLTGNVGRDAIHNQGVSGNEQALKREIELLQGQLADKERTIQILLSK